MDASRAHVLHRLRERLDTAAQLTAEMRQGLRDTDVPAIERATSRLETVALECKLLQAEFQRLPADGDDPAQLEQAFSDLADTATRLARSGAVSGGLLERLVSMSTQLISTLAAPHGETYVPTGKTRELPFGGLNLKGTA